MTDVGARMASAKRASPMITSGPTWHEQVHLKELALPFTCLIAATRREPWSVRRTRASTQRTAAVLRGASSSFCHAPQPGETELIAGRDAVLSWVVHNRPHGRVRVSKWEPVSAPWATILRSRGGRLQMAAPCAENLGDVICTQTTGPSAS